MVTVVSTNLNHYSSCDRSEVNQRLRSSESAGVEEMKDLNCYDYWEGRTLREEGTNRSYVMVRPGVKLRSW